MKRAAATLALAVAIAGCSTAPRGRPIAHIDVSDVESVAILSQEQVEELERACCNQPTVLDGSSQRGNRDWRRMRQELARTEARLWLPVLAQECRSGSPDTYAFIESRWRSPLRVERAFVLRAATANAPPSLQRIERRGDDPTRVQSIGLDAADAQALATRLEQLAVRRFPAEMHLSSRTDMPAWFFETCLDGGYRMTWSVAIRLVTESARFRDKSEFYRAVATLIDAAEQRGLLARPETK